MQTLLFYLHKIYKLTLSPLIGERCRFFPSCSDYFIQAVTKHGTVKGSWLGIKRICKCNPWHPGGTDPVPENISVLKQKKK